MRNYNFNSVLTFISQLLITSFFTGCNQNIENRITKDLTSDESRKVASATEILFAEGFSIEYFDNYKLVTVNKPWKNASMPHRYILIEEGKPIPEHENPVEVVRIPLKSIACLSTTHIPFLEMLDVHFSLKGFSNLDFISSPAVRKLINKGEVRELGPDGGLNLEVLAELSPDALMAFSTGSNSSLFNKVKQMGIPVILNADYLETSALGRAEWIKFTSAFYNKEQEADSIFNAVKTTYDSLTALARQIQNPPTVYSGIVYGDIWYVPGGKSWAAKLLEDAGGNYLWKENDSFGSLELSFEKVYEKAVNADYWINVASFNSIEEILQADKRYGAFQAVERGNVYSYNARIGEKGGNEYMETGYARPDIILADLIKIINPELLPGYQLYFYKKLPPKPFKPLSNG